MRLMDEEQQKANVDRLPFGLRFRKETCLGEGNSACVYKLASVEDGQIFTGKILK